MQTTYKTRDGDMLDDICWRHYGADNCKAGLEAAMMSNPGLAELGPVLPAGVSIILPEVVQSIAPSAWQLWD